MSMAPLVISPSSMSRLAPAADLTAQLSFPDEVFSLPLPLRSRISRSSSGVIGVSGSPSSDGALTVPSSWRE